MASSSPSHRWKHRRAVLPSAVAAVSEDVSRLPALVEAGESSPPSAPGSWYSTWQHRLSLLQTVEAAPVVPQELRQVRRRAVEAKAVFASWQTSFAAPRSIRATTRTVGDGDEAADKTEEATNRRVVQLVKRLQHATEAEAGLCLLQTLVGDLLAARLVADPHDSRRSATARAALFDAVVQHSFVTHSSVDQRAQWLVGGVLGAVTLGALFFVALKGATRGLDWQLNLLRVCLVEWSVKVLFHETVSVYMVHFLVPNTLYGDVEAAATVSFAISSSIFGVMFVTWIALRPLGALGALAMTALVLAIFGASVAVWWRCHEGGPKPRWLPVLSVEAVANYDEEAIAPKVDRAGSGVDSIDEDENEGKADESDGSLLWSDDDDDEDGGMIPSDEEYEESLRATSPSWVNRTAVYPRTASLVAEAQGVVVVTFGQAMNEAGGPGVFASTARAALFDAVVQHSFVTHSSVDQRAQWLVGGVLGAVTLGALFFVALKGATRGLDWQLNLLRVCLVEWSVKVLFHETVSVYMVHFLVPNTLYGDVEAAALGVVSAASARGVVVPDLGEDESQWRSVRVAATKQGVWEAALVQHVARQGATILSTLTTPPEAVDGRLATRFLRWLATQSVATQATVSFAISSSIFGVMFVTWIALRPLGAMGALAMTALVLAIFGASVAVWWRCHEGGPKSRWLPVLSASVEAAATYDEEAVTSAVNSTESGVDGVDEDGKADESDESLLWSDDDGGDDDSLSFSRKSSTSSQSSSAEVSIMVQSWVDVDDEVIYHPQRSVDPDMTCGRPGSERFRSLGASFTPQATRAVVFSPDEEELEDEESIVGADTSSTNSSDNTNASESVKGSSEFDSFSDQSLTASSIQEDSEDDWLLSSESSRSTMSSSGGSSRGSDSDAEDT
eukprot:gene2041-1488_t